MNNGLDQTGGSTRGSGLDVSHSNNFNLLRLFLASLVLLSHSFELIDGDRSREPLTRIFHTISFGDLAVDGFFILSGYLIVGSWLNRPRPLEFLKHRVLRIFPGFLACALACVLIVGRLGSNDQYFAEINYYKLLTRLHKLHIEGLPLVFVGTHYADVNGPVWTLNPEFQCYLLVLFFGLLGIIRRPWLYVALGATLAAIYILHFSGVSIRIDRGKDIYQDIVRFMMVFIAGGAFQILTIGKQPNLAVVLACIVVLTLAMFDRRFAEPALATCGGYLILAMGYVRSPFLARFRQLPDASYGTYLYGWPIQKLLLFYFPLLTPLALFGIALPMAWVAGTISWYLIERPALTLR